MRSPPPTSPQGLPAQLLELPSADLLHELPTIRDWIRLAASLMDRHGLSFGQGSLDPWDDARWLVLRGLSLAVDAPDSIEVSRLLPAERHHLRGLLERRILGREPTAYLLQEAWLQGYRFRSDPRAIIPRSHLAELIVSQEVPGLPESPRRVLDLCTGSGCLAILAALAWPEASITAIDLSGEALALAAENVSDYDLHDRIHLLQGDMFGPLGPSPVPSSALLSEGFDLIVCNPPYVPEDKVQALTPEFQKEPRLALTAGIDGMDLVRRLLSQRADWQLPDACLLVEIGHERERCEALFAAEFPELEPIFLDTAGGQGQVFVIGGHA